MVVDITRMADTAIERHFRKLVETMGELLNAGQSRRGSLWHHAPTEDRFEVAFLKAREALDAAQRFEPEPPPKITSVDWHQIAGDALMIGDLDRAISIINDNRNDLYSFTADDLGRLKTACDEMIERMIDAFEMAQPADYESIENAIQIWKDLRARVEIKLARAKT